MERTNLLKRLTAFCLTLSIIVLLSAGCKEDKVNSKPSKNNTVANKIDSGGDFTDPENTDIERENGSKVTAEQIKAKTGAAHGIDVSKWQGKIDWQKVKTSGIDFAIIRIGFRGDNGVIYKDANADYNLQSAKRAGLLTGVYFFSTAINANEAKEEALWVADAIKCYPISYPVVYDCEGYNNSGNRMYGLSANARTNNAIEFLTTITNIGYEGMFYSSKSELESTSCWEIGRIENSFNVWVARYPAVTYPAVNNPDYNGKYDMWQYTNKGSVDGVKGNCDMIVSYTKRSEKQPLNSSEKPKEAQPPEENDGIYTTVSEEVTAKEETNLRDGASTKSNIISTLKKGTFIRRIAIGNNGWSKLEFNGQTVYAINSYLTTDRNYAPPVTSTVPDDGFTVCNEEVTAKSETNLRNEPSTKNPETVVHTLRNGEFLTRIGINKATGWSKISYNGQTLYAVSSYLLSKTEYNSVQQ